MLLMDESKSLNCVLSYVCKYALDESKISTCKGYRKQGNSNKCMYLDKTIHYGITYYECNQILVNNRILKNEISLFLESKDYDFQTTVKDLIQVLLKKKRGK